MNKNQSFIIYEEKGAEGLDTVKELWAKLRQHHKERSPYFKDQMDKMTWEERKQGLLDKGKDGSILVETARSKFKLVGYCISSISDKNVGEIESIYIEKEYRAHNIGDHFMKTALEWMDNQHVTRKIIGVAVGNEEAFGFYCRYGFYPRVTTLMQIDSK